MKYIKIIIESLKITLIIFGLMFLLGMVYIGIMAILCRYIPFMMAFGIELFMTIFIPLAYIQIKDQKEGDKNGEN